MFSFGDIKVSRLGNRKEGGIRRTGDIHTNIVSLGRYSLMHMISMISFVEMPHFFGLICSLVALIGLSSIRTIFEDDHVNPELESVMGEVR
jgi:hypothetical protein